MSKHDPLAIALAAFVALFALSEPAPASDESDSLAEYWDQCRWKAIHDNCFKPVAGQTYTEPCYGDPGQPYYTDCSSEDCAYAITCQEIKSKKNYTGGTCTGFCYGCDASGNGCKLLQYDPQKDNLLSVCQTYCGCSP